jgi:hypothetical protein
MSTNLEVYFCDLCNESVPHTDLQSGQALRVKGRVIGGCCLKSLRTVPTPVVDRRTSGAATALVGVVVLAGVAGAAAFLDWRVADEVGGIRGRLSAVEERSRHSQERLAGVEEAVTRLAGRIDLDALSTQVAAMDGQLGAVRTSVEMRIARLEESLQAVLAGDRASWSEQRSEMARLREMLDRLGGEVAALAARPNPPPATVAPSEPLPVVSATPASTEPELPAELRHHVLALADEDPGTRFSAVDKLVRSKSPLVLSALIPMAKDDNTFIRRLTVDGLRGFRRPESVDALLVALSDPESLVRITAHASLRDLTGQKIDFDDSNASSRGASMRRWQEWWEKNRATFSF